MMMTRFLQPRSRCRNRQGMMKEDKAVKCSHFLMRRKKKSKFNNFALSFNYGLRKDKMDDHLSRKTITVWDYDTQTVNHFWREGGMQWLRSVLQSQVFVLYGETSRPRAIVPGRFGDQRSRWVSRGKAERRESIPL